MSRLPTLPLADAPEAARPLFEQIRRAAGMVPNAYAAIGAHSPAALALMLGGDGALARGTLSKADIEAVRLAISAQNGCDYCVAAHSMLAGKAGLKPEALHALRTGEPTGDERRDALVHFARATAGTRGTVPEAELQAVLAAGFTPAQVTDTLLVISLITFTNLFNRVNDTVIDFPTPA
ncbi:carboxymuconolactone decarboxylase family protein [Aquincola sp. MAHUQ-54]|uniref:Carboxymuconolactone decarboxylase family protein n=1 Tax=Aquincola agrisoli TaxID=3119538 RepID=A0AAW9Q720_9BURK